VLTVQDIYTEPHPIDVDTLANLGPLRALAGTWRGTRGLDVKPKAEGPKKQAYVETISLQPIDPQTNGPQLLYGLRYHTHVTKPEQVKTYHDQVGYWLWEPATQTVIHTLVIPRGVTVMAVGQAAPQARNFKLRAVKGDPSFGICSAPFLVQAFDTVEFTIEVTLNGDGTWSYEQDTVLCIAGQNELFHHVDRNTLSRIAEPEPNPLACAKNVA
jgi:hypothetical protein